MKFINTKEVPVSSDNINILINHLIPCFKELEERDVEEITIAQQLIENSFHHYWYSNDVVHIKYKSNYYFIRTHGNVCITLYDKHDDSCIDFISRKPFNKNIYSLHDYISNDKELEDIIQGKSSKYKLQIIGSDWWEVYSPALETKNRRNPIYKLNEKYLKDAIIETLNVVDDLYK